MTTIAIPELTEGLDLGDRKTVTCLMRADKTIVSRPTVDTTRDAMREHFSSGTPRRVVLEASTPANWIARIAAACGHEVIIANPRQVRLIANNPHKNDHNDAELLADLGRSNPERLSPVTPRTEQQQADLAVVHARERFVSMRAQCINFLRSQVKVVGERLPDCGSAAFHNKIDASALPPALKLALQPVLEQVQALSKAIKAYDKLLEQIATDRYPQTDRLQQVPGVGRLVALTFVLLVADPKRFACSRDVGPYFGLVPRQKQSSQSDPKLSITKQGSTYMRSLLVNSAHYILGVHGPDGQLRRTGLRIYEKGGKTRQAKRKAVVAIARKLAVLLHRLWVSGADYDPYFNLPPQAAVQARAGAAAIQAERKQRRQTAARARQIKARQERLVGMKSQSKAGA
jgi:transposase